MSVKHPARVGGGVTGESFERAKLLVEPRVVRFNRADGEVEVTLPTVSSLDRLSREIHGGTQSVLAVRHMPNGQALTTLVATRSARKMSILGRYLRPEYSDLMTDLEDDGLVVDGTEGSQPTPKGRVVVSNHLEDVNE